MEKLVKSSQSIHAYDKSIDIQVKDGHVVNLFKRLPQILQTSKSSIYQ